MSAPDAFVVENEFQNAITTILYIPAIECLQLSGNWLFYHFYPDFGDEQLKWAWIVWAVLMALAMLAALFAVREMNINGITNARHRVLVFMLIFTLPVIQLQAAIQAVFTKYRSDPTDNLTRFWNSLIASAVLFALAFLTCKLLCAYFDDWLKRFDTLFINPTTSRHQLLPQEDTPVKQQQPLGLQQVPHPASLTPL